jgi:hypothetical protein
MEPLCNAVIARKSPHAGDFIAPEAQGRPERP